MNDEYRPDVDSSAGCAELWEHMMEERAEDDEENDHGE
jgi:hypothetical protein